MSNIDYVVRICMDVVICMFYISGFVSAALLKVMICTKKCKLLMQNSVCDMSMLAYILSPLLVTNVFVKICIRACISEYLNFLSSYSIDMFLVCICM